MNPCNDGTDIYVWINKIRNWSFAFISNVLSHNHCYVFLVLT